MSDHLRPTKTRGRLPALVAELGDLDIYLLDQLMKGRIREHTRVLDAGCGAGRNLELLLRCGVPAWGVDRSPEAIAEVRALAAALSPGIDAERFRAEPVEVISFPDESFDVVISSAVLHFAEGEAHFDAMLRAMWRVLAPGGMFFARLASTIGIETLVQPLGDRRFRQPDGGERFLVDRPFLVRHMATLGAQWLEPLKTTVVDEQRAMSTWVVRKRKTDASD